MYKIPPPDNTGKTRLYTTLHVANSQESGATHHVRRKACEFHEDVD